MLFASVVHTTCGYMVVSTDSVVNTFSAQDVTENTVLENLIVKGKKVLEGREWKEGDVFEFKLEQHLEDKWTELGRKIIVYDKEKEDYDSFEFTDVIKNIRVEETGIYEFRVSETTGTLAHMNYDDTMNQFSFQVTDLNHDGRFELSQVQGFENVKVRKNGDVHEVDITFFNQFIQPVIPEPTPVVVIIPIEKTIENKGDIKLGADGFEIVLENVDTGECLTSTTKNNGSAMFELRFTEEDVNKNYHYRIYEKNVGQAGMIYDDTVYDITVLVEQDGEEQLVVSINGKSEETFVATFHNIYKSNQGTGPTTGDTAKLSYGFAMMIVSAAALIVLWVTDREKKEKQEES